MSDSSTHFLLEQANSKNIPNILTFYKENPDRHIMPRPEDILSLAASNGNLFLLYDNNNEIAGVSGIYGLKIDNNFYVEAGGSLIKEKWRGNGLHKILHYARSLTAHTIEDRFEEYFGAIICPNPQSVGSIKNCLFEEWKSPPSKLVADRAAYAGKNEHIEFFRLPEKSMYRHASLLIDTFNNKSFIHHNKKINIIININIINDFLPQIEEFARLDRSAPPH